MTKEYRRITDCNTRRMFWKHVTKDGAQSYNFLKIGCIRNYCIQSHTNRLAKV